MRAVVVLMVAAVGCGPAAAAPLRPGAAFAAPRLDLPPGLPVVAPLPRPRPPLEQAGPARSTPPADPEAEARQTACLVRLASVAEAEPAPPVLGKPGCETRELVRLAAIRLPGGARVAVQPGATLRCSFAEALAHFVRDDMVAVAVPLGAPLTGLVVDSSYECRPRNRIIGAKMSEHGTGNAIDVRGMALANGRTVLLADPAANKAVRAALADVACRRFTTVLGPGSDGFHEEHVHFDLAEHSHGTRYCKWDVRDPAAAVPLPRPRPRLERDVEPEPETETEPQPETEPEP